jgi:hypothetical protein
MFAVLEYVEKSSYTTGVAPLGGGGAGTLATEMVALPAFPAVVAVIVAEPPTSAETSPLLLTVTIAGLVVDQATV